MGSQSVPEDPPPPARAPWLQDMAALPYSPHLWEAILTPSSPWASHPWQSLALSPEHRILFPPLVSHSRCNPTSAASTNDAHQLTAFNILNSTSHFFMSCGISVLRPSHLHSENMCEGSLLRKQTTQLQPSPCKCRQELGPSLAVIPKLSGSASAWETETSTTVLPNQVTHNYLFKLSRSFSLC